LTVVVDAICQSQPNGIPISDKYELSQRNLDDFFNNPHVLNRNSKLVQELESRGNFNMRLDSSYIWKLDGYDFFLNEKIEHIFDEDNLREIELFYVVDKVSNSWIPKAYSILNFNKKGFLVKQIYNNSWNGDYNNLNDDFPNLLREFTYDENDNLVLYEDKTQQDIINGRVLNQMIRTYDSSNNLIQNTWNRWNNDLDSLTIVREFNYSYDNNNNLVEEIRWSQHSTRGWEKTDSIVMEYSETDMLISKARYIIIAAQTLELFEKEIFTYSNDDQLFSKVDNIGYKADKDAFSNIYISEFEYDNYNNLVQEIRYDSIVEYNDREFLTRKTYTHNNGIYSTDVQMPKRNVWMFNYFLLENSIVQPMIKYENVAGGGGYPSILADRVEYFYSDLETSTTGIELDNAFALKIHPSLF